MQTADTPTSMASRPGGRRRSFEDPMYLYPTTLRPTSPCPSPVHESKNSPGPLPDHLRSPLPPRSPFCGNAAFSCPLSSSTAATFSPVPVEPPSSPFQIDVSSDLSRKDPLYHDPFDISRPSDLFGSTAATSSSIDLVDLRTSRVVPLNSSSDHTHPSMPSSSPRHTSQSTGPLFLSSSTASSMCMSTDSRPRHVPQPPWPRFLSHSTTSASHTSPSSSGVPLEQNSGSHQLRPYCRVHDQHEPVASSLFLPVLDHRHHVPLQGYPEQQRLRMNRCVEAMINHDRSLNHPQSKHSDDVVNNEERRLSHSPYQQFHCDIKANTSRRSTSAIDSSFVSGISSYRTSVEDVHSEEGRLSHSPNQQQNSETDTSIYRKSYCDNDGQSLFVSYTFSDGTSVEDASDDDRRACRTRYEQLHTDMDLNAYRRSDCDDDSQSSFVWYVSSDDSAVEDLENEDERAHQSQYQQLHGDMDSSPYLRLDSDNGSHSSFICYMSGDSNSVEDANDEEERSCQSSYRSIHSDMDSTPNRRSGSDSVNGNHSSFVSHISVQSSAVQDVNDEDGRAHQCAYQPMHDDVGSKTHRRLGSDNVNGDHSLLVSHISGNNSADADEVSNEEQGSTHRCLEEREVNDDIDVRHSRSESASAYEGCLFSFENESRDQSELLKRRLLKDLVAASNDRRRFHHFNDDVASTGHHRFCPDQSSSSVCVFGDTVGRILRVALARLFPSNTAFAVYSLDEIPSGSDIGQVLTCPISLEIMQDPVICRYGHTYERTAIIRWLERNNSSPINREPLYRNDLRPNHTVRALIARYSQGDHL